MDLRSISHQSYLASTRAFVRHCVDGHEQAFGSVRLHATGAPIEHFNNIIVEAATPDPTDVDQAIAWCKDNNLPFTVAMRESADLSLRPHLERQGFKPPVETHIPVMAATRKADVTWPAGLGRLDGLAAYEAHLGLSATVFSIPTDLVAALISPTLVVDPEVSLVVGTIDGMPVTTALGVVADGVIGIYNVATLFDYRGRGYGAAVTGTVANEAFDRGASVATLQSSPLGFSIYERLGFRTVDHHERWTHPVSASQSPVHITSRGHPG